MDKKFNIEFGTPTDPKSLHQLLGVFPKPESFQELKSSISELLQELLSLTFPISLVQKDLFMLSNFHTELEEI